jgi:hypothetical protein
MAICEQFVDTANQKIKKGRMLGESDHPAISNLKDPRELKRQLSVLWENVTHKFNKIWIEAKDILSIVETTSNAKGTDLARLACLDHIPIGFSCRAVGNTRPSNRGQNIVEVAQPAIFVTYDAVTDPSHTTAELKDISSVITSADAMVKLAENTDDDSVVINECNELVLLRDLFLQSNPVSALIENFLGGTISNSQALNEDQKVRYGKSNINMLIQDYLSTSDYQTGISSNPLLNETNVHGLLNDYANTHRTEYNSTKDIKSKIAHFLSI